MEDAHNKILVGVSNNLVFIKVEGKGTFQISQPLRQFTLEMMGRGYREFVVDLADCPAMDSTFLGVLAGMGLRLQNGGSRDTKTPAAPQGQGKIHLANMNSRCLEVLSALGIDRLFSMDLCDLRMGGDPQAAPPAPPVTGADLRPLQQAAPLNGSPGAMARQAEVMLEAHRTLMEIAPQNIPKFKDVTRFLSEDLEKHRAAEKSGGS